MSKFIRVKAAPGYSESLIEKPDYYVNVELITFVLQDPQNPDRSSLRLVGSDQALHISESAESFLSRTGGYTVTATPVAEKQAA
jgi:hypothetical protein